MLFQRNIFCLKSICLRERPVYGSCTAPCVRVGARPAHRPALRLERGWPGGHRQRLSAQPCAAWWQAFRSDHHAGAHAGDDADGAGGDDHGEG